MGWLQTGATPFSFRQRRLIFASNKSMFMQEQQF
jgi:hypothetical protein